MAARHPFARGFRYHPGATRSRMKASGERELSEKEKEVASESSDYLKPTTIERAFNSTFGLLVRLGIGLPHNYLLQVPGRRSGRIYSAPIDLLTYNGRSYLVSGRGRTQWVRNAEAAGRVTLRKGLRKREYAARSVPVEARPPLLKAYLDRFKTTVQRYFSVAAGSPESAFVPIAERHPVFELVPLE